MIDETDISKEMKWLYEERAKVVVNNLQKGNINAQYVPNCQEALSVILDMIPPGVMVARGDSITLDKVGVIPELKKRNQNKLIDAFERDEDGYYVMKRKERLQKHRESFFADIYLTGTNAITLDGKLVNTDGIGNRVAAMIFGPEKVILAIGTNKIVKDVDEARERIRQVAAPLNAKRHYLKHHAEEFTDLPCVVTGRCIDCKHDYRICRYTVIIEGNMVRQKGRINVVLIGEELGL